MLLADFRNKFLIKNPRVIILGIFFAGALVATSAYIYQLNRNYQQAVRFQESLSATYADELFNNHLLNTQLETAQEEKLLLEQELTDLKETNPTNLIVQISEIIKLHDNFKTKLARNTNLNLDTQNVESQTINWGNYIINKNFIALTTEIEKASAQLDSAFAIYSEEQRILLAEQAAKDAAAAQASTAIAASGYSFQTVKIDRGSFGVHLIKLPLSEVRVKTLSANKDTCKDNCPTKALADYVKDGGGFAGIHGSYFCPPDYEACKGKVNSYDYALYNSDLGKWLSKDSLNWNKTGLATFNGRTPNFYRESTSYGGSSVTAGIVNYPTLVKSGKVVVDSGDLTSFQKDIKGPRGAIGVDSKNIYLAIISNATVIDAAYVMRSLGADDALNLDGGGSSAMYIGNGYVVGPGRSLPNAIILTR
jgi:hypothetical protein